MRPKDKTNSNFVKSTTRQMNRHTIATTSNNTMANHHVSNSNSRKISARAFYSEFRGHRVEHLESLVYHVRNNHDLLLAINSNDDTGAIATMATTAITPTTLAAATTTTTTTSVNSIQTKIIWTAGDSSLDNKYWFRDTVPTVPTYQSILQPPISKPDVTYWLNQTLLSNSRHRTHQQQQQQEQEHRYVAVNAAVEASTLSIRTIQLLPQDEFIRDHIQENDVLIVSIGGNDVALVPQPCTIVSILCLVLVCPTVCTARGCIYGTIPIDDYCCSCGPSLWSCLCGCPPCLGYFRHLFGYRMQHYIQRLTSKTKPAKVVVCMIYYPDESNAVETWANRTLQILGYNSNPNQLQTLIRKIYSDVITTIQIKDTEMIYVPLYRILNGQTTEDYVARVEPSVMGGKKMAEYIYASAFPSPSSSLSPYSQSSSTNLISLLSLQQRYAATAVTSTMTTTDTTTTTPSSSLIHDRE